MSVLQQVFRPVVARGAEHEGGEEGVHLQEAVRLSVLHAPRLSRFGDAMVIIVVWMDGLTETYPFTSYDVEDGQLNIYRHSDPAELLLDEWHLPLANIRVWKPERQQAA